MHEREHVKTDLWEFCRAHDVVSLAETVALDDSGSHPPPPLDATVTVRLYVKPGILNFVDRERASSQRRPLTFHKPLHYREIVCEYEECLDATYDRGEDDMARCAVCNCWFHMRHLDTADAEEVWEKVRLHWADGQLHGPVIRREPNRNVAEFVPGARGLWVRVDPPVLSWGRAADAVQKTARELATTQGLEAFDPADARAMCSEIVRAGGEFGGDLTLEEVDEVMVALEDGVPGAEIPVLYTCKLCHETM